MIIGATKASQGLVVDSLTIGLPSEPPLVDSVSFRVDAGERVALLGRSGSGKSLVASAVAAMPSPVMRYSGSVTIGGRRNHLGRTRSPRTPATPVGLVQQDSSDALNPLVKVGAQLAMPFVMRGEARSARTACIALLESIGITDAGRVLDSYPAELSGGQRQRICVALALACEAELVVADEPTTALDVVTQAAVVDALVSGASQLSSLLFITHDLAVAATICDRAIVLDHGLVAEDRSMAELFLDPDHEVSQSLVGEARARSWAEAA